MSYYDGENWAPYVSVAERRRKAEREIAKLRKKGYPVAPVVITKRAIATTFWGTAWNNNLESYRDYANRLERGRSYVRNGSVFDLQVTPRKVEAMVSGSQVYQVRVDIDPVPKSQWTSICKDCAGGIDSLVELLQGKLSQGVMERICRQRLGLFPEPKQIRFACTCPDYASMCKHVAAVLYGIGARLDAQPELLFRLRAVDEKDLVSSMGKDLPLTKRGPKAGKVLDGDLSAMFGLEMAQTEPLATKPGRAPAKKPTSIKRGKAKPPARTKRRTLADAAD